MILKDEITIRLNRIEGQVRGVQKMILDERECGEIVQQLSAIKSSINSVSRQVIENYLNNCLTNGDIQDPARVAEFARLFTSME